MTSARRVSLAAPLAALDTPGEFGRPSGGGAPDRRTRLDADPASRWRALVVPGVVFLLLVYLLPAAVMLRESVLTPQPGLHHFRRLLTSPAYTAIGFRTLWMAALATALTLALGYPLAYCMATSRRAWQRALMIAVVAPLLTSSLVRTFAWQILLGQQGVVTRFLRALHVEPAVLLFTPAGVIVAMVHILLPPMVLVLFSVMRGIDPGLARAGQSLGAGPARSFLQLFLPLTMPGVEAGVVLTFVFAMGAFVMPALLGGQAGTMYGTIIQVAIDQFADHGLAAATGLLLGGAVGVVLVVYRRMMAGNLEWLASAELLRTAASTSGARPARRWPGLGPARAVALRVASVLDRRGLSRSRLPLAVFSAALAVFLLAPQLIALPVSLSSTRTLVFPPVGLSWRWYASFWSPEWMRPLGTSVLVGTLTAGAATLLGGLAAFGVSRGFGARATRALSTYFLLPMLLPSITAVVGVYVVFLHLRLTDSVPGFVLAHTALAIPGAFVVVGASVRTLDPTLERAAASLGAPRRVILARVVLPLVRPALIVSLFFTFLLSFDEVTFAVFLSGVHVKTLPRRMFEAVELEGDPTIGVVATLSMLVATMVLLVTSRYSRARGTSVDQGAR